jgi:uncharacterized FAD-dependent dehydrogenase
MSAELKSYVINNIPLSPNASFEEAFSVAGRILRSEGISVNGARFSIFKKSIDARKKKDIKIVYSVLCEVNAHKDYKPTVGGKITELCYSEPDIVYGSKKAEPPVVIGSGPCGLFAALLLAQNGYRPVLIERGGSVSERKEAVLNFCKSRILNTNTNIQFGAGGAGTFSDGKLITRINDPFTSYVLKTLVKYGAGGEILYHAKPHIGTDVLAVVVDNIIEAIKKLGGTILFNTQAYEFVSSGKRVSAVKTSNGSIVAGGVILAIGHSARDTYLSLLREGFDLVPKDFSVGLRIEHPKSVIDKAMFGDFAGHKNLGAAEYALSYNTKKRGVYTFCMCPGGEVVAATSELGGVVVNGMSNSRRDGKNSNSAVCCSVFKSDFGNTVEGAISFQRRIEHAAYVAGGSDYSAPIITVGDFLADKCVTEPGTVLPTYMIENGVRLAHPKAYLPEFVCNGIKGALVDFDKKIKGFAMSDAILTGPETRTSSPIRILRDSKSYTASLFENVYPAGEGAGYAGGITSAAVDGLRCAIKYMSTYCPID